MGVYRKSTQSTWAKMMRKMSAKMGMKKKAMKMSKKKMMKKAMRVSKVGKKYSVFSGKKVRTSGGLKKTDLTKNKRGKVVGKKAHAAGKKNFKNISKWSQAFKAARKSLGIKGFCAVGGKTKQGQQLLAKTRSLYKK